jgi:hypothetical protein
MERVGAAAVVTAALRSSVSTRLPVAAGVQKLARDSRATTLTPPRRKSFATRAGPFSGALTGRHRQADRASEPMRSHLTARDSQRLHPRRNDTVRKSGDTRRRQNNEQS